MHYRISSYVAKAEPYLGFDFFPCHEFYCGVRRGEKKCVDLEFKGKYYLANTFK